MRETQKKDLGKYIIGHGSLSTWVDSIEFDNVHADRERESDKGKGG